MAKMFRPREVLKEAELAEQAGNARVASKLYHTLALHLSKKMRWPESYQLLEKAIKLSKKSARLQVLKALLTNKMGQKEDCLQAIKTFISLSIEKGKLTEYVAYMEDHLREMPALRKWFFEELLKIERTSSFAFIGLARTLVELNEIENAKSILLEALKTKDLPQKVASQLKSVLEAGKEAHAQTFVDKYIGGQISHQELSSLLQGKSDPKISIQIPDWEGEKDLKGLIADLEKELGVTVESDIDSVKPLVSEFRRQANHLLGSDAKARIDIALAFFEMGLYQDATEELNYIPTVDPKHTEALSLQGKILMAQGADLKALAHYQKLLREAGLNEELVKDALYQMVEIYSRIHDFPKALEAAKKLEKMDPSYREIHRLKINIEELSKQDA